MLKSRLLRDPLTQFEFVVCSNILRELERNRVISVCAEQTEGVRRHISVETDDIVAAPVRIILALQRRFAFVRIQFQLEQILCIERLHGASHIIAALCKHILIDVRMRSRNVRYLCARHLRRREGVCHGISDLDDVGVLRIPHDQLHGHGLAAVLRGQIINAAEEADVHDIGESNVKSIAAQNRLAEPRYQLEFLICVHFLRELERNVIIIVCAEQAEGVCIHIGVKADEEVSAPGAVIVLLFPCRLRIEHELILCSERFDVFAGRTVSVLRGIRPLLNIRVRICTFNLGDLRFRKRRDLLQRIGRDAVDRTFRHKEVSFGCFDRQRMTVQLDLEGLARCKGICVFDIRKQGDHIVIRRSSCRCCRKGHITKVIDQRHRMTDGVRIFCIGVLVRIRDRIESIRAVRQCRSNCEDTAGDLVFAGIRLRQRSAVATVGDLDRAYNSALCNDAFASAEGIAFSEFCRCIASRLHTESIALRTDGCILDCNRAVLIRAVDTVLHVGCRQAVNRKVGRAVELRDTVHIINVQIIELDVVEAAAAVLRSHRGDRHITVRIEITILDRDMVRIVIVIVGEGLALRNVGR